MTERKSNTIPSMVMTKKYFAFVFYPGVIDLEIWGSVIRFYHEIIYSVRCVLCTLLYALLIKILSQYISFDHLRVVRKVIIWVHSSFFYNWLLSISENERTHCSLQMLLLSGHSLWFFVTNRLGKVNLQRDRKTNDWPVLQLNLSVAYLNVISGHSAGWKNVIKHISSFLSNPLIPMKSNLYLDSSKLKYFFF